MNTQILLINPWVHDFAAANLWARPLGLLKVAEWLSVYALDLQFVDCMDSFSLGPFNRGKYPKQTLPTPKVLGQVHRRFGRYGLPPEQVEARLRGCQPKVILMTSIMTYWYPGVFETITLCKRLFPGVPIILGGIYARLFPEHARAHSQADLIFTGNSAAELIPLLQQLGLDLQPWRTLQPYYRLGFYPLASYAPLLTSEGCPFRCHYCASPYLSPGYHHRPTHEVAQEIFELHALGVQDLAFYDDALLYRSDEHLLPLLDEVLARDLPLRFHTPNALHARWLTRPVAQRMKAAGFRTIRLGLETTDPVRQRTTGNKVDQADLTAAVEHLHSAGYEPHEVGVYLMYGLPGQPWDEVESGVALLETLRVRIHLTEYSPLPQTLLWDPVLRAGWLPENPDPLLTNHAIYAERFGQVPTEALRRLKLRLKPHPSV